MKGQIIKIISGFYDVEFNNQIFRVRGSGKLRFDKNTPLVGDFVEFEKNQFITKIYKRKNSLIRPKVANVDQVIILTSLKNPDYSSLLLHKVLANIEVQNIKPIIFFTKIDLVDKSYSKQYKNEGYEVYEINNLDKKSFKYLYPIFKNKLSVFTGQTGAGKSTTIQNITHIKRDIQEISKALKRGKHTTRVVELLNYKDCKIIDTPGFSSLNINLSALELSKSFKIFKEESIKCKFHNCLHNKEKNCRIKLLVDVNKISKEKYQDYLKILKEVKNE